MRRVTQKQIRIVTSLDLDQLPSDDGASLELENWIRHGLKALPAAQQITVELVFFLGLSYQEVAAVCDCSVNTVKTRMFHARKKLKTLLEPSVEPTSSEIEKFDD